MNKPDESIIYAINELMKNDTIQEKEQKFHELFDLIAQNPNPIDVELLNFLKRLKEAFETLKNNSNDNAEQNWLKSLEDLKGYFLK